MRPRAESESPAGSRTEAAHPSSFASLTHDATGRSLRATSIDVLQVNTGLLCNQECVHCHVESSPRRTEMMTWETMQHVVRVASTLGCGLVDITGGAPELHDDLPRFVEALVDAGVAVQVRTNLTVLTLPRASGMIEFFRSHRVRLVASLPCYLEENVEKQRGDGVFAKSIAAIRSLNDAGYGVDPELPLDLVFNPIGPVLPPPQASLEDAYRRELDARHGIRFTNLYTITNMPIGRFIEDLDDEGRADAYRETLRGAFNPATLEGLMCRSQLSVRWDGVIFDCDFNLALGMPARCESGAIRIEDFDPEVVRTRPIVTAEHCFGCTAGAGSSCGGALT